MKQSIRCAACLLLLTVVQGTRAQVQVGNDLKMNLNGVLTGGYNAEYGTNIPPSHGLDFGGNANLTGFYYNPNFLNFSVQPYYGQSRADSNVQSLTDSSGVIASANLFTGTRFPAYVSYDYNRNSTGNLGLVGAPNFTTVGNSQGFGVGWSALISDWPTFSVSYAHGSGSGTIFGTDEESSSTTDSLNLRSSYRLANWQLNAQYQFLGINSSLPFFLGGEQGSNIYSTKGNNISAGANHSLPWHGAIGITFSHQNYWGDYGTTFAQQGNSSTNFNTNIESVNVSFTPTPRLGLFANESYSDNLNGYIYQSVINNGGGVPLIQTNSQSNSVLMSGGASYKLTSNLYSQAQITYYHQTYFGQTFNGSFVSGTLAYGKRILNTFTVSASVIESSNRFASSSLGFIGNLNAYRHLGAWGLSGNFSYAQNVQTYLVSYTQSYYNYSGNLHRNLGKGLQWTLAANGSHTGFSQYKGTVNSSEGASTTLALRRFALNANYVQAKGQSLLTSTGIAPIPPTPGLPPDGVIVYNGKSYGGGITLTPIPRLSITGNYSHAMSDTLSDTAFSKNKTDIFYSQLQYRLRKISIVAGYTKFTQGISASGTPPGSEYSYYAGVSRWFNFF